MPRTESDAPYAPRHLASGARRRRRARVAVFAALGMVVAAAIVAGGYLVNLGATFNDRTNTIAQAFPDSGRPAKEVDDGSRNILLLGSDSRGEGQDLASVKGEAGERSDTLMLVHIPEDRKNIHVMSIVRDLWVEIPGHGERKINSALNLGGYPLVVETVENLLATKIDNVVSIDFEGFKALTEALNGVTVENPVPFCSGQVSPSCFEEGEITLQGTAALRYVRERKAFADGDFHRVQNQQRFVKAVVNRFLTPETLSNPVVVNDVVNQFSQYISVDDTLDAATVAGLALQLKDVRGNNIHMFTIPTGPPSTGPGGASIITRDEAALAELRRALSGDTLAEFLASTEHGTNAYGGSITAETPETTPEAGGTAPDAG